MKKSAALILLLSGALFGGTIALAQEASPPKLRGEITPDSGKQTAADAAPAAPQDNSVESFFQIPKDGKPLRTGGDRTGAPKNTNPGGSAKESSMHGLHGLTWHILDNLGVPMFFGKETGLDPKLSGESYMTVGSRSSGTASAGTLTKSRDSSTRINQQGTPPATQPTQDILKKIPESELEGTGYEQPAKPDTQQPAP